MPFGKAALGKIADEKMTSGFEGFDPAGKGIGGVGHPLKSSASENRVISALYI
jgi:hypothetical protein